MDFAIGEMKIRHGGIGFHPARICQPAVKRLFAFAPRRIIQVRRFERALPADDVAAAALVFFHQRRADGGRDFHLPGQVQVPARAEAAGKLSRP